MINNSRKSQLILIMILSFCLFGCKEESSKAREKVSQIQKPKKTESSKNAVDTIVKILENGKFKLSVTTLFSKDTLAVIDYKEDIYSSPIILTQNLSFFENGLLIQKYNLPITSIKKKTINNTVLNTLQTPLYKACIVNSVESDYYIVYGSDYCNGSDCPEFTGIYSMSGKVIYEGISTIKQKVNLKSILLKYKIKLDDNLSKCINTDDFWKE